MLDDSFHVYDTTLRDGAQQEGLTLSVADKLAIARHLDGLGVAMIHDAGPASGRPARMRRRFPAAALVIFGHSHIPLDHAENGQRIFNPGSPTDRRRQPRGTLGRLDISRGRLASLRLIPVTPEP